MNRFSFLFLFLLVYSQISSQTNFKITHSAVEDILKGNYAPEGYFASTQLESINEIKMGLSTGVNSDSLKSYMFQLATFENRNTGSDTISESRGIGAARRWAYDKLRDFSQQNENRLLPFYFQFDEVVCGMAQHRNICAILPGADTMNHGLIIIEGHIDSRCDDSCDIDCPASGMEDNGSGTALVMELARVMSQYTFKNSILFMLTIGEEQGLVGANAFATYAKNQGISIKAVFNNDVIGGIHCGESSSPPSCEPGTIDSLSVRLFSSSSSSRQLSKYIRFQYEKEMEQIVSIPMSLQIMNQEDRTGRGGDHIPFRQKGYPAMRFTSAHEHGDADVSNPDYIDRQHTSNDVLGVDTDHDGIIDSFFVDFNYLGRNAVINGFSALMISKSPKQIDFKGYRWGSDSLLIQIIDPYEYNNYLVFYRTSSTTYFDTIYPLVNKTRIIVPRKTTGLTNISVCGIDDNGVESCFSPEKFLFPRYTNVDEVEARKQVRFLTNYPNPFYDKTTLQIQIPDGLHGKEAELKMYNSKGKLLNVNKLVLAKGINNKDLAYESDYSQLLFVVLEIENEIAAVCSIVYTK